MRQLFVVALVAAGAALAGCGPNCQSTCERIYDQNSPNCGIRIPGTEVDDNIDDCIDACELALEQPGDLGNYDPFNPNTGGAAVQLENEKQAAVWMDCVENTSCPDINDGFCAPISF